MLFKKNLEGNHEKSTLATPCTNGSGIFVLSIVNRRKKFRVSGRSEFEGDEYGVTREIPCIHRRTEIYKKWVLAKFYPREEYFTQNLPDGVTLLIFTPYPESFALLKSGWNGIRESLNYRQLHYVWIFEPQKQAFPHIHVCILGRVSPGNPQRLKKRWHKYGCGSTEHGAQFSEKMGDDPVKSIRNHLTKYVVTVWRDSECTTA